MRRRTVLGVPFVAAAVGDASAAADSDAWLPGPIERWVAGGKLVELDMNIVVRTD